MRPFYKTKNRNEKTFGKNKKCIIKNKNNKLSDTELCIESLKKIIINNDVDNDDNKDANKDDNKDDNKEKNICTKCNKFFYSKSNLNKHQKNVCFKETNINNIHNIQNIEINQNITNKIININNININYIKGFDEEWDVSKIDVEKKGEILLSNSKFSKTLENILQNDANLNVILSNDDAGIVYKNQKDKYKPMSNKDIIEKSMKKIYKHLKEFYNEIINNNINDLSETALLNEINELEKKYNKFFILEDVKNIVKNSFTLIFNKNKDKSSDIYNNIVNNENDNDNKICDEDY